MNRMPIKGLMLAAVTLVGIAVSEGYKGEAYIPVPGDVPTIGMGRTEGVKIGDKTTPVREMVHLLKSLEDTYAAGVKRCIKSDLFQYEFDAYVSLTYNIGVNAFCASTLAKKVNEGDYAGGCAEIKRWDKFKGRSLSGLTKRREHEYKVCIGQA